MVAPLSLKLSLASGGGDAGCPDKPQSREPGTPRSLTGREAFESLDEFITLKSVGRGTFASVQQVVHRNSGRVFALKTVKREGVIGQGGTEEQIAREAIVQLRMRHRNIVQLYGNFDDGDRTHLVLELAPGGQLLEYMRKEGRLKQHQAARMFLDVVSGLMYVHEHGIVHRDIKPENVLLVYPDKDKSGMPVAKIADFGCCAMVTALEPTRNTICGTMDYLAPEMIDQQPHDHRVDVWAVGVLLYEMLVSSAPFKARSQLDALRRIVNVDLRCPCFLDARAAELIRALLQKEPEMRLTLAQAAQHVFIRSGIDDSADVARSLEPAPEAQEASAEAPEVPCSMGTARHAAAAEDVQGKVVGETVEKRSISPVQRLSRQVSSPSAGEVPRSEQSRLPQSVPEEIGHASGSPNATAGASQESTPSAVEAKHEVLIQSSKARANGRAIPETPASTSVGSMGSFASSHATAAAPGHRTSGFASRLRSLTPDRGDLEETIAGLRDGADLAVMQPAPILLREGSPGRISPVQLTPRGRQEHAGPSETGIAKASRRTSSPAGVAVSVTSTQRIASPAGSLSRDGSPGRISPLVFSPRGRRGQPEESPAALAGSQAALPSLAATPHHAWLPRLSNVLAEEESDAPQLVVRTSGQPRAKAASTRTRIS